MPTEMTVVRYLIVANVVVFALQLVFGDALIEYFALWPLATDAAAGAAPGPGFQLWQLISSAFLHGNLAHIALNMFGLYMFGRDVETVLGRQRAATDAGRLRRCLWRAVSFWHAGRVLDAAALPCQRRLTALTPR
jgi:membrane associated rhomboid family serine protease